MRRGEITGETHRLAATANRDQGIAAVVNGFKQPKLSTLDKSEAGLGGDQELGCELNRRDRIQPGEPGRDSRLAPGPAGRGGGGGNAVGSRPLGA